MIFAEQKANRPIFRSCNDDGVSRNFNISGWHYFHGITRKEVQILFCIGKAGDKLGCKIFLGFPIYMENLKFSDQIPKERIWFIGLIKCQFEIIYLKVAKMMSKIKIFY